MTWPGIDYHNHICGAPIEAMLAAARERGVREFGITEHIYMLYEGQTVFPNLEEEGVRCSRAEYVATVQEHALDRSGPLVRLGLEVDFVPGTEAAVATVLDGVEWDYLLGSIHVIDDIDIFEYIPSSNEEGERLWRRYYALLAEAIESGMFDVITHPVRNAERNPHLPPEFDRTLEEIAAFAKLHGVALELNGYDTVTWPHLVERLANACGRTGCVVSFGSDAHSPDEVTGGLHQAAQFAAAAGIRAALTSQRRERRLVDL